MFEDNQNIQKINPHTTNYMYNNIKYVRHDSGHKTKQGRTGTVISYIPLVVKMACNIFPTQAMAQLTY